MLKTVWKVVWLCHLLFRVDATFKCDRTLPEVGPDKKEENSGLYAIEISGNPTSYVPGEQYTVFLRAGEKSEKFARFMITLENGTRGGATLGSLQLYGDSLTKFSEECNPNTVVETDLQPKSEIQVLWLAPTVGNGCVAFKGAVMVSDEIWYKDDGTLTKLLCQDSQDTQDAQPATLQHCCACDEAKYEVTFEGASHTVNYTFWKYGDIASEGLRQLAENGNTRMLESELKAKSDHIRTIVKARGISYPNITGKTFAVFRVDNRHHLMSIVSMVDPSPDWIVGVSSLELCLRNCSWIESKVLNLYPWDAGTDDGITYISPNQPSSPRQPIRRIRPNSPNDPRSPFYDTSGNEMKPLARLYLSRQRLYEKVCDPSMGSEDAEAEGSDTCDTEEWSEWSPCSATCGRGIKYKQRRYKNEESKYICHKKLTERAGCEAIEKYCPHQPPREIEDPMCLLGAWSEWSGCSATCGRGVKTRDRKYKNRIAAKTCASSKVNPPKLQENLECWGEGKCDDFDDPDLLVDEKNCPESHWSDWSPCSSTCGKGFKVRFRILRDSNRKQIMNWPFYRNFDSSMSNYDEISEDFDEEDPCNNRRIKESVECFQKACTEEAAQPSGFVCSLPKDVGECKSNVDRWYFDNIKGDCEIFSYSGCEGNLNNFKTLELCQKVCAEYQKELIANLTAHKRQLGVTVSGVLSYNIQNDAVNVSGQSFSEIPAKSSASIDCELSKWSSWSHQCNINGTCGTGHRTKHRQIKVHARNGGKPCPKRLTKRKKCHVPCTAPSYSPYKSKGLRIDCVMSVWSEWSQCECNNHDKRELQERYRHVAVHPTLDGAPCRGKIEKRPCSC